MAEGPSAVRLVDAGFAWPGSAPVIAALNLEVPPGQLIALLGPSGCGKSTLLRLAAGLLAPTQGRVEVGAGDRAFVFQRPNLLPWRRVWDNVALPLALRGPVDAARVDAALARVGLREAAQRWPHELSGGMQMRASLARALVTTPSLMLLDEPFSALDALTRARIHQEFLTLWGALAFTALLVTHDPDEAVLLADRVVVLRGPPLAVALDVPVPLPRPRHPALLHDGRLGALVEQAVAALGEPR